MTAGGAERRHYPGVVKRVSDRVEQARDRVECLALQVELAHVLPDEARLRGVRRSPLEQLLRVVDTGDVPAKGRELVGMATRSAGEVKETATPSPGRS